MSLLQKLNTLGDDLIAGEIPAGHEVPKVLAALIHWCESGSLEAPERAPSVAVQRELNEDKAEIERLKAQLAEAQAAGQPQAPPPAPPVQAPAPTPPAPEPSPVVPSPPSPVPPAGGQVAAPQPPAEQA